MIAVVEWQGNGLRRATEHFDSVKASSSRRKVPRYGTVRMLVRCREGEQSPIWVAPQEISVLSHVAIDSIRGTGLFFMRTRPRPSDEVTRAHKVRWTLVMRRPERSVDVGSAEREPTQRLRRYEKQRIPHMYAKHIFRRT